MKNRVTPKRLRVFFRYDRQTGKLFWKKRGRKLFATERAMKIWNSNFAGKPSFSKNSNGYQIGVVLGKRMSAHRAIWAMHHGAWPKLDIDHINGVKTDNRIQNLREANRSENLRNRLGNKNTRSRYCGVTKHGNKWQARASIAGKQSYLGLFKTQKAAALAYDAAAKKLHGKFARLNFP